MNNPIPTPKNLLEIAHKMGDADSDCLMTFWKAIDELVVLEKELAARMNVTGTTAEIHYQLVEMHKLNVLHDEDWLSLYSTYRSFIRDIKEGLDDGY